MSKAFRRYADGHGIWSVLLNLKRVFKGYQPIFLDYPVDANPRYGYGKPPHPEIEAILTEGTPRYADAIRNFVSLSEELRSIPVDAQAESLDPFWNNQWFSGIDLIALYGFVIANKPASLIEVGSGQSTKIARRAIRLHQLPTRLISIDPHPRAEIDRLCDKIIRQPLERCDLSIFDSLEAGDIFFFDGSHRAFMNSDVTVFFLEILPRLKPGVLVHIHDIFLPDDYLPWWQQQFYPHRYWSEQYVLAASLLAGHKNYEIVLPNHFLETTTETAELLNQLWSEPALRDVPHGGSSFWIRTR